VKGHGQLRAQIYPDIRLIMKHDQTYHTDLLQTLRAYIFSGRNAAAASEQLHIHKSTFFYRMNKIAELLGADIYDRKRLFAYEFTFYLIDYLKSRNLGGGDDLSE
jgi:DNA-binding PucR family transcriptional regulator